MTQTEETMREIPAELYERLDYEKIIHICQERIRQIDHGEDIKAI